MMFSYVYFDNNFNLSPSKFNVVVLIHVQLSSKTVGIFEAFYQSVKVMKAIIISYLIIFSFAET